MSWSEKFAALSAADRKRLGLLVEREGTALNLFPLSYTQEWIWWNNRLRPASPAFHVSATLRLDGTLRVDVLERTLREIVSRHETLRTGFHALGRIAVQAAEAVPKDLLHVVDLCGLPEAERDAETVRVVEQERLRPFPLTDGRMLRAVLLRLTEDSSLLALTTHQLVFDDWSIQVLVREVAALYPAFCADRPSPLEPLPVQYADFSLWQRQWLTEERLEKEFEHWEGRLDGIPHLLDLPADLPRPPARSFGGTLHDLDLGPERTGRLREQSSRFGVTSYMTLTALFHLWLSRVTGQDRFATSTLTAYRERPEVAGLIGDFSNMITVAADLGDHRMMFHELLLRTRDAVLEAQEHADLPAHRLTGRLRPRRDESHNPLTQAMFLSVHAMNTLAGADLAGLRLRPERVGDVGASSPFDIEVRLVEKPDTIVLQYVVSRDLFRPESVPSLAGQFEDLLDAALERPDAELTDLAAPAGAPTTPTPSHTSRPTTAEPAGLPGPVGTRTAASTPSDTGESTATGVADAVAAWADRHPGRAAVDTPSGTVGYGDLWQRARQEAEDLADRGDEPLAVPAQPGADGVARLLGAVLADRTLLVELPAADGTPTRTELSPRHLAGLLRLWTAECGLAPQARCARLAPPGTALWLVETLLPLYAGATLCPEPGPAAAGAPELPEALAGAGIGFAVLPAGVLHRFAAAPARFPGIVIVVGEHGRLPAPLRERRDGTVLRALGPEGLTLWPFRAGADLGRGPEVVPGQPGVGLWVADAAGRRPQGAVGELFLTGASVPGGPRATGLLGRETFAGTVELLGRTTEQTDHGGYRIRPCEVRWALTALDGVVDVAVRREADGTLGAVLAVGTGADVAADERELRRRVNASLPAHLRPAVLEVTEELPVRGGGHRETTA
ncbi:condensation domain-containing protein [Streptomyces sp. NPDC007070]|uniref:condensation domain-containing protein n=1 Tax=Streptomyces sp. NPDC007070 TaxID=3154312 RepID=UPI0033DCB8F4